jgi:hypothetical protein
VRPRLLIVLGTLASDPYAGMAWMHMQIAAGLQRLGHHVYYFEVTSAWPYDPVRQTRVDDVDYAVPYLRRVAESFGLADRWALRASFADGSWYGLDGTRAEEILAHADLTLNVTGATRLRTREGLSTPRLVYLGTDPPFVEVMYAQGDPTAAETVEQHDDFATYGENLGTTRSPVPALPRLASRTRQPVLLDVWRQAAPSREAYTTVCNWKQEGSDVVFEGTTYHWSKHHEILKIIDLPRRVDVRLELAMGLAREQDTRPESDFAHAVGMTEGERRLLDTNGWTLEDAHAFTTDPWPYRDYIRSSRGELSPVKDAYARLRTGWFSERSACYLAAGKPVVAQDTGFGSVLPTGEGLFAFNTAEEAAAALEEIESDYGRHSRAAEEIAGEYFSAETVLARLLDDLDA